MATAGSTNGGYVEIEATYLPHSAKPPKHLHPSQTEDFTILSGGMTVIRGDETFEVGPGDEFLVPPGVPHQMWAGAEGAVLRWRTSPALRTGEMFCALWADPPNCGLSALEGRESAIGWAGWRTSPGTSADKPNGIRG